MTVSYILNVFLNKLMGLFLSHYGTHYFVYNDSNTLLKSEHFPYQ